MKKKTREILTALGSVFMRVIPWAIQPLLNQRGEAGPSTDDAEPGSDALEHEDDTGDETPPPGDETPVSDKPGDQPPDDKPPGDQPPDKEPSQPPEKSVEVIALEQKVAEFEKTQETFQAELKQANEIVSFYQGLANQNLANQSPDMAKGQPVQPGVQQPFATAQPQPAQIQQPQIGEVKVPDAASLPQGVLPPEQWEEQSDQARYTEARIEQKGQEMLQNAYQNVIMPTFQQISTVLGNIHRTLAKMDHADFDEVSERAVKDLFNVGPDGRYYGVKDQARLAYFQNQENPYLALYQHGLTLNAPEIIQQGVDKQTKTLVKKLEKKPKAPTQPKGAGAVGDEAELDWDTTPEEADQILHKKGIVS